MLILSPKTHVYQHFVLDLAIKADSVVQKLIKKWVKKKSEILFRKISDPLNYFFMNFYKLFFFEFVNHSKIG